MFGGPDIPAPPPPPAAPDPNSDAQTQQKLNQAADLQRKARGRQSTILTGGLGDQSTANTSRRTLLGS